MKQVEISYEQMRSLVIHILAQPTSSQLQLTDLWGTVAAAVVERHGVIPDKDGQSGIVQVMHGYGVSLTERDCARVTSIIWDLIIEGVVRPGHARGGDGQLPFFYVTDWGQQKIKDVRSPFDPDGYLEALKSDIPDIEDVIIIYLTESLHTFRLGSLLSSTITLGCASEKALLLLIGAYGAALPTGRQEKFQKHTEGFGIKRQFDEFTKMLDSHLNSLLPGELRENLDVTLLAVFAMLRTNRNDAGHPTGRIIRREEAYASLMVFPTYLQKVYALLSWLRTNTPLL